MNDYRDKLKNITTFIFDFDGVLSDGKIWVLPDGDQLRATGVKDGYALQYALRKGYRVAVISGGYSESMRLRYKNFPGMEIFLQVRNKVKVYNEYLDKYGLSREEVMMMGDDIPDYEIMQLSGLKCCPADAAEEIKAIADYVSVKKGGEGAARDVIEQTLKAQGRWFEKDACIW
ncbi:MAG: HAD hydrolase family protein [Bacteroidales bacterium]|nr:HAD hydrolase family protein [Bacteroidales bacterium]